MDVSAHLIGHLIGEGTRNFMRRPAVSFSYAATCGERQLTGTQFTTPNNS